MDVPGETVIRSLLALSLVAAFAAAASAQSSPPPDPTPPRTPDARCKDAVDARHLKSDSGKNCDDLAVDITTKILHAARKASKRTSVDLGVNPNQPSITDTPGAQVSAGQTAAVASGQPVGTAGGSVTAVGATGRGLQLVAALAINPGTIAIGDTDTRSVWLSRFADVSIVVPTNIQSADGGTKGFSYIGSRLRLNVAAAFESSALESSRDRAVANYTKVQATMESTVPAILKILQRSPDPTACANALEDEDLEDQTASCKATFDPALLVPTVQTARRALTDFRSEADRHYLSLEARYDRGDLNADAAARKDALFAAYIAGGYTFSPTSEGASVALRARGGVVFLEDGMTTSSKAAGFGALGTEVSFTRNLRRYTLSLGLEIYTKQVNSDPMLARDQRNAFKVGVAVPVADGKILSVGLTVPMNGGDPGLAVSGDWSLLLGSAK